MAPSEEDLVSASATLTNISSHATLHRGLIAVSTFGLLSFVLTVALFLRLTFRLLNWSPKPEQGEASTRSKQLIILIINLILADIQQSVAFLLNIQWIKQNSVEVGTTTCFAQGWFVSTGDLSSGLFTLAIACHAFAGIVYDFRLGPKAFGAVIAGLWTFNYALAIIGVGLHHDLYQRAGAWCWIDSNYTDERLYLHYFWLIIAEFGTVIIYFLTWIILRRRVSSSFYPTDTLLRARTASKYILAYPVVYIVCTLPLVKARLTSMAGGSVSFLELTIAGALITCNGWLDVLLYVLTRRALLFGAEFKSLRQEIMSMIHLRPDERFGTTTVIEGPVKRERERPKPSRMLSTLSTKRRPSRAGLHSRSGSTDELFTANGVKSETTVVVHNEVLEMDSLRPDRSSGLKPSKQAASMSSESQASGQHSDWRRGVV